MNVLVIGGAGYIGSHVTLALRDAGHRVAVFDNLSSGLRENLLTGVDFIHGDILRADHLRDGLAGIDAVIHLAAFKAAGESMIDPGKYAWNNIAGTIALLNEMNRSGVRSLVFSSSAAVYGEPEYQPIDENHPTRPANFYGFSKLEVERILGWFDRLHGLRSASLRYFNAAGYDPDRRIRGLEQNPANLLPVVMEAASGRRASIKVFGTDYDTRDGTGVRDYIHVTDLARAHVAALEHVVAADRSEVLNLGSETGASVMEIIEATRAVTGREITVERADRRPGDPASLVASSQRAKSVLGWHAELSDVETIVRTTWNAYSR